MSRKRPKQLVRAVSVWDNSRMKALITGGTSGIGLALAEVMAEHGHDLVLAARSAGTLNEVAQKLSDRYKVKVSTYEIDLSTPGSAKQLHKQTKNEGIDILVNNAGVGYVANFFEGDIERNKSMSHLNMVTVMELCHYFGKDFKEKDSGKILNIASTASFLPGPAQPVYYASKAFVRSLSRTLAHNLRNTKVSVTVLHPGVTKTHFFDEADAPKQSKGANPRDVATVGYDAMMRGQVEITHGFWNKILTNVFVRLVPYRLQAPIVDKLSEV